MAGDAWITAGVLIAALGLLVRDRVAPSAVVLGATVTLLVLDVIDASQAFSGFSNAAPITVAALYVVAHAVEKTGLLAPVTARLLGAREGRGSLLRLLLPASATSAFLNNTPLVAMMIPNVVVWSERNQLSAARFLMPLSFATILGGLVTVLGTSTNLVVSGLLEDTGEAPLGLFELAPVGGPVALVGLALLLVLARRLLPERRSASQQAQEEFRQFVVTMHVVPGGSLDGRAVVDTDLRDAYGVFAVQILREGEIIAPVGPQTVLRGDDEVMFLGSADQVLDLQHAPDLRPCVQKHLDAVAGPEHTFFEAVVGRSSPLVGRTLTEVGFRARYDAAVVAIHRDGQRIPGRIHETPLRVGDTLLLLAAPEFAAKWKERRDFLLVAHRGGQPQRVTRQAPVVGAIVVGMVLVAALGLLSILEAALLAGAALVFTGTLQADDVRDAVDLDVIVLIGAAFGLGEAVEATGLADVVANGLVATFDVAGTAGIVFGILLATVVLTEMITNNAAAVVVFPIALATAVPAGVDPRNMAIALAVAASSSFLTPIGYQTNTMVYGPGGYRFTDYARLGAPLTLAMLIVVTFLVTSGA